jgi:hypothetical protein
MVIEENVSLVEAVYCSIAGHECLRCVLWDAASDKYIEVFPEFDAASCLAE